MAQNHKGYHQQKISNTNNVETIIVGLEEKCVNIEKANNISKANMSTCSTLLVKCALEWNGNPPEWSDSPWASIDFKRTTVIQFTLIWEITMTTCIDKSR